MARQTPGLTETQVAKSLRRTEQMCLAGSLRNRNGCRAPSPYLSSQMRDCPCRAGRHSVPLGLSRHLRRCSSRCSWCYRSRGSGCKGSQSQAAGLAGGLAPPPWCIRLGGATVWPPEGRLVRGALSCCTAAACPIGNVPRGLHADPQPCRPTESFNGLQGLCRLC